jgi:hypothetical protein
LKIRRYFNWLHALRLYVDFGFIFSITIPLYVNSQFSKTVGCGAQIIFQETHFYETQIAPLADFDFHQCRFVVVFSPHCVCSSRGRAHRADAGCEGCGKLRRQAVRR